MKLTKILTCLALLAAFPAPAQTNQLKLEEALNKLQQIPPAAAAFKIQLAIDAVEFCRTQTKTVERSNQFMAWLGTVTSTNEQQLAQITNRIAAINNAIKAKILGPVTISDRTGIVVAGADIVEVGLLEARYKVRNGIGGGFVGLDRFSPQLQAKLGYDPRWAIGMEFVVYREHRRKAEARLDEEMQRVAQENNRAWREWKESLLGKAEVLSAQTRLIEDVGEFSKLAYVVKIANRNDHFVLNDVKVNLLDSQGLVLETDTDYGFETPAWSTNELRGTFFLSSGVAQKLSRTQATLTSIRP